MKIAIVTDLHLGARNDSELFLDHFLQFFEEQFFPYLESNGIDTIIHLGDFFDRRKYVNVNTLHQVRSRLLSRLEKYTFHTILGNHDTYYRSTNEVNSLREILSDRSSNIVIHEEPYHMDLAGLKVLLVPWLNKKNREEFLSTIKKSNADIVMGHFEINGYEVIPGLRFSDGLDARLFRRFRSVFSGHFHMKQTKDNIHYLGTPYQITFSDANQRKGFHVLDTETGNLEFVENRERMFHTFVYDEDEVLDRETFRSKYVKIMVDRRNGRSNKGVDLLIDELNSLPVANLTIVELEDEGESKEESIDLQKDTLTIISEEIDRMGINNSEKLKKVINELYVESLDI
jgi:DNA repair exonuclease SbcCD nuclease subunit